MKRLKRMRLTLKPCLRPILENSNSVIPLGSRIPSLFLYYMFSKFNKQLLVCLYYPNKYVSTKLNGTDFNRAKYHRKNVK